MRKFILSMGMFQFIPIALMAQTSTTDKFTISEVTLQPGGELASFVVSLEGSQIYTAYNMEIELPKGVSFTTDSYGDVMWMEQSAESPYPYVSDRNGTTYQHSFNCAAQLNGNYRVSCVSTSNADFTANSGKLFNVNIIASPFAKPGEYTINMTGLNLTANVEGVATKYVPEGNLNTGTVTVGTSATVPVNINATNKYGTCILPFALSALPDGVKAYKSLGINGDVLSLEEVESLDAYTPYILYAENGYNGSLNGTVDASLYPKSGSVTENGLTGIVVAQEVTSGYILQNQGEGAKFYKVGSTPFALPAGRCYLAEATAASNLRFVIVNPTDITDAVADDAKLEVIYDLLGRRVTTPLSGKMYISTKHGVFVKE